MNIYEKYEFLVNNGWVYSERENILPHIFTHPNSLTGYTHKNLEQLIHDMYIRVSDKSEHL